MSPDDYLHEPIHTVFQNYSIGMSYEDYQELIRLGNKDKNKEQQFIIEGLWVRVYS